MMFMSQIISMNIDINNNLAIEQLQRSEKFINSSPFNLILENIVIYIRNKFFIYCFIFYLFLA